MERIDIQLQDKAGNWRTQHAINESTNSPRIRNEMQQLQRRFPDQRVRAVDSQGRLVDIL